MHKVFLLTKDPLAGTMCLCVWLTVTTVVYSPESHLGRVGDSPWDDGFRHPLSKLQVLSPSKVVVPRKNIRLDSTKGNLLS